jgi:hypothetical protein
LYPGGGGGISFGGDGDAGAFGADLAARVTRETRPRLPTPLPTTRVGNRVFARTRTGVAAATAPAVAMFAIR